MVVMVACSLALLVVGDGEVFWGEGGWLVWAVMVAVAFSVKTSRRQLFTRYEGVEWK
jgi:hypothetical protein